MVIRSLIRTLLPAVLPVLLAAAEAQPAAKAPAKPAPPPATQPVAQIAAKRTVLPSGGEDTQVNALLASVNGEPILLSDVLPYTRAREFQAQSAASGADLIKMVRDIRKEAVEALIERRLLVAEYRKKPFDILPAVIDQQVDEAAERFGCRSRREFIVRLRERGIDIEDFRRDIEERMICQIMLYRESQLIREVTPKEIFEAYEKDRSRFEKEEEIELGLILIKKDHPSRAAVLQEVAAELTASPDRFAALAGRVSDGPGAGDGGRIGVLKRSELRPEFQKVIPQNVASGWWHGPVETPDGSCFLKVLAVQKARRTEPGEIHQTLLRELTEQLRQKNRDQYLKKLRSQAVIRYYF